MIQSKHLLGMHLIILEWTKKSRRKEMWQIIRVNQHDLGENLEATQKNLIITFEMLTKSNLKN